MYAVHGVVNKQILTDQTIQMDLGIGKMESHLPRANCCKSMEGIRGNVGWEFVPKSRETARECILLAHTVEGRGGLVLMGWRSCNEQAGTSNRPRKMSKSDLYIFTQTQHYISKLYSS